MRRLLASWWIVFLLSLAAVIVVPMSAESVGCMRIHKAFADLEAIRTSLENYRLENERYPTTVEGIAVLMPRFIKRVSTDAWGSPYAYRAMGDLSLVVYSVGLDGRDDGGLGDDVTTRDKKYTCSIYGMNCGLRSEPLVLLFLLAILFASAVVGMVRGGLRLSNFLRAKH